MFSYVKYLFNRYLLRKLFVWHAVVVTEVTIIARYKMSSNECFKRSKQVILILICSFIPRTRRNKDTLCVSEIFCFLWDFYIITTSLPYRHSQPHISQQNEIMVSEIWYISENSVSYIICLLQENRALSNFLCQVCMCNYLHRTDTMA